MFSIYTFEKYIYHLWLGYTNTCAIFFTGASTVNNSGVIVIELITYREGTKPGVKDVVTLSVGVKYYK